MQENGPFIDQKQPSQVFGRHPAPHAPPRASSQSERSSWEREERGASRGQAGRREMEVARREREESEGR